jgi:hypothetical protein
VIANKYFILFFSLQTTISSNLSCMRLEEKEVWCIFHLGSDMSRVNVASCHGIWEINLNCNIICICIYMNLRQNLICRFCSARLVFKSAKRLTLHLVKRMWCGLFIMPMLNIVFVLALNLIEVNIPSHHDTCALFDILCLFVAAERIHYLEYELLYLQFTYH